MIANPALRSRTITLVGLMGAGKTTIGRRLATALDLPFRDVDMEIELAAGRTVSQIFEDLGEAAFRAGEHRVIARLLGGPPHVLATGGGAFVNADTRRLIKEQSHTVWLKADLETLARRVSRRGGRPLLVGRDPLDVLKTQAEARYPAYAEADLHVDVGDGAHHAAVEAVVAALNAHIERQP